MTRRKKYYPIFISIFTIFVVFILPLVALADSAAYTDCINKTYDDYSIREEQGMSRDENNALLSSAQQACRSLLEEGETVSMPNGPIGIGSTSHSSYTGDCPDGKLCLNVPIGGLSQLDAKDSSVLGKYLTVWYNLIIGAVGVLATVMVMYGGFKWLTSRGNSGEVGQAKEIITSAIIGMVLAFLSFTILYLVNPRLTRIEMPKLDKANPNFIGSAGPLSRGSSTTQGGAPTQPSNACQEHSSNNVVNYDQATARNPNNSNVNQYDSYFNQYAQQYGVDSDVLRAICVLESGCNANTGDSPVGACGMMQIMPETAESLGTTCAALRSNPELSIEMAAKYLRQNGLSGRPVDEQLAGYNGGGGALRDSRDCPGVAVYECCIDPGGYVETQNYAYNGTSYYNYFQQN